MCHLLRQKNIMCLLFFCSVHLCEIPEASGTLDGRSTFLQTGDFCSYYGTHNSLVQIMVCVFFQQRKQ